MTFREGEMLPDPLYHYPDLFVESVFSLSALESKLVTYVQDPSASSQRLDLSSVPKISRVQAAQEAARMLHFEFFVLYAHLASKRS